MLDRVYSKGRVALCLAALVTLPACGGGADTVQTQVVVQPPAVAELLRQDLQGLEFAAFLDESFRQLTLRTPERVVSLQLEDEFGLVDVGLDNLSEAFRLETLDMVDVVLSMLVTGFDYAQLSVDEQVSFDAYRAELAAQAEKRRFLRFEHQASYGVFGVQGQTEQFFTETHPMNTVQDARDYVARLRLVGGKFNQLITNLDLSEQSGIVEPAPTLDFSLYGVADMANIPAEMSPYYVAFSEKIDLVAGITDNEKQQLLDDALAATQSVVVPAYQRLEAKMASLMAVAPQAIGYGQYPDGDLYYDYMLRTLTTTDLTPDEIHNLGIAELARISTEIRSLFDTLGYPAGETMPELIARATSDGGIVAAVDVIAVNQSIVDVAKARLPEAFDIWPAVDVGLVGGPYGGFYVRGSADGTRPGAYYIGLRDTPYFEIPTIAYHETLPGHHMQISIAQEAELPYFHNFGYFGAYIEGWGQYAEILAGELGWHEQDLFAQIGQLHWESIRAARLVVDTGIHARGWSFDEAAQYYSEATGKPLNSGYGAAARFTVIPGQATTYMIGALKILELRDRTETSLGQAFSLEGFHAAVLLQGPLPLLVLENSIDSYIASQ